MNARDRQAVELIELLEKLCTAIRKGNSLRLSNEDLTQIWNELIDDEVYSDLKKYEAMHSWKKSDRHINDEVPGIYGKPEFN